MFVRHQLRDHQGYSNPPRCEHQFRIKINGNPLNSLNISLKTRAAVVALEEMSEDHHKSEGFILWGPWIKKLNSNPSNSCWDILVWTLVFEWHYHPYSHVANVDKNSMLRSGVNNWTISKTNEQTSSTDKMLLKSLDKPRKPYNKINNFSTFLYF